MTVAAPAPPGLLERLVADIPKAAAMAVQGQEGRVVSFRTLYAITAQAKQTLVALDYQEDELAQALADYCRSLSAAVALERQRRGYVGPPMDPHSQAARRLACRLCHGSGRIPYKVEDKLDPFHGATYQRVCTCIAVDVYGIEALHPRGDTAIWARLERYGLPAKALRERWTLDSFGELLASRRDVDGAGERELALEVARAYVRDPVAFPSSFGGRSSLLFTGDWGTGKTSLVCGILRGVTEREPSSDLRFLSWSDLLAQLKNAYASKTGADRVLIEQLRRVNYLALDDIGDAERTTANAWERTTAEEVLLERYNQGARTLLTSNLTKQQLEQQLGGRLVDRIYGNWAVCLDMPGESLRGAEW